MEESAVKFLFLFDPFVVYFSENFNVVGDSGVNVGPVFRFGFPVPQIVLKKESIVEEKQQQNIALQIYLRVCLIVGSLGSNDISP